MSDLAGFLKTQLAKIAASSLTEKDHYIQNSSFLCLTTLPPKNPKITLKKQQEQDRVVQSWVKITQGLNSAKFEFKMWKHQTQ